MTEVYRGDGGRIVVRERRGSRRLEIDGTFASWWRPGSAATGGVWDALVAPLLALDPARRGSVLILGLGGGSAARLVRALAPRARIVGVELDREVLRVARRWFDLDSLDVEVSCDDARAFLARERRRFDLVIDDVFVGRGDALRKPTWLLESGLALAARRLAPGGLLVSNTIDEAPRVRHRLAGLRPHAVELRIEGYDNRVQAVRDERLEARDLRRRIAREPILSPTLPVLVLRTIRARR